MQLINNTFGKKINWELYTKTQINIVFIVGKHGFKHYLKKILYRNLNNNKIWYSKVNEFSLKGQQFHLRQTSFQSLICIKRLYSTKSDHRINYLFMIYFALAPS